MSVILKSPSEYLCISDQLKKSLVLALFGARVFFIKYGDMNVLFSDSHKGLIMLAIYPSKVSYPSISL